MPPPRILLLGGIGSGKSLAAESFAELGARVISADVVARRVLDPGTPASAEVLERWPEAGRDGVIDRAVLGRIVFADPDALSHLESITHPETRHRILAMLEETPNRVVVVEMPILRDWFDEGWIRVVVDAPAAERVARVLEREPGMTEEDVRRIMERQPSRQEWLLAADFVLDNSGAADGLAGQCGALWGRLTA